MINWKVRLKNKNFWLSLIPALLLLIQAVAYVFGFSLDLSEMGDKLLAVVNALAGAGAVGPGLAAVLAVAVAVLFAGCLVCYVLYFRLSPMPSFVDGALPLAAVGVLAAAMAALVARM